MFDTDTQSKFWCFTAFYEDKKGAKIDVPKDETSFGPAVTYLVMQDEICPDTQRLHVQGYVEFKTRQRFSALRKKFPTMHLEMRKGTGKQAADYCKTDETATKENRFEFGVLAEPEQGKRSDLEKACDLIKAGGSLDELAEQMPATYVRYKKGLGELKESLTVKRASGATREIVVLWGYPGSGKSAFAHQLFKNSGLYIADRNNSGKLSFENYAGQETIFLDEFVGKENLSVSDLKIIADRHDCMLPGRGVSKIGNHQRLVIASNLDPELWYPDQGATYWAPFKRRVTAMYFCEEKEKWTLTILQGQTVSKQFDPIKKFALVMDDGRQNVDFYDV